MIKNVECKYKVETIGNRRKAFFINEREMINCLLGYIDLDVDLPEGTILTHVFHDDMRNGWVMVFINKEWDVDDQYKEMPWLKRTFTRNEDRVPEGFQVYIGVDQHTSVKKKEGNK
jgi:hypothetical protein